MNRQLSTLADRKTSWSPVGARAQLAFLSQKTEDRRLAGEWSELGAPTSATGGHDFGRIAVHAPPRADAAGSINGFASACPLALASPQRCPFGGACHACPARVQTKLAISQPGDEYEQEADRVAEQVMRLPAPDPKDEVSVLDARRGPTVQQKCAPCEEDEKLQRRTQSPELGTQNDSLVPPIAHEVLRSPGRSLDAATRAFMEPRFGHDFSRVRVHTDARAAGSARSVNALAYTVGGNLVFGSGQYAPGTSAGAKLIAHELVHVLQQGSGSAAKPSPIDVTRRSPALQKVECDLKPVEEQCNNAAASCMAVDDYCKKKFPTAKDLDAAISKGKAVMHSLGFGPNAVKNFEHWLDNTGTELVMPSAPFISHPNVIAQLLVHRQKFIAGVTRRLKEGTLVPGTVSEEIVWTDSVGIYSSNPKDDLAFAVGGFTFCSKVRVKVAKTGASTYHATFTQWQSQAFDCYNWDPGKSVFAVVKGLAGLPDDKTLCCVENAAKAKHFRIRTEPWSNKEPDSIKDFEIKVTVPEAKPAAATPNPEPSQ